MLINDELLINWVKTIEVLLKITVLIKTNKNIHKIKGIQQEIMNIIQETVKKS